MLRELGLMLREGSRVFVDVMTTDFNAGELMILYSSIPE